MISEIFIKSDSAGSESNFLWVDVVKPDDAELNSLAERFNLHKAALLDCLEPEHLPKVDFFGESTFLILRAYDQRAQEIASTVQQLSRKIAIFILPETIVTVHRLDIEFIDSLRSRWESPLAKQHLAFRLLSDIIRAVVDSYEPFIEKLIHNLNHVESSIFQGHQGDGVFNQGYHLRRKAHLTRHMLGLTADLLGSVSEIIPDVSMPYFSRISHKCNRLCYYADDILGNVDNLLALHLAMLAKQSNESSNKTNEVMRFLTVFSAFFLPLNFVASIYGMNFEYMPELKHPLGYYATISMMVVIGLCVLGFFKRKGYLSAK